MKICIVSPSLKMGGIERALTTLATHFVKRGHSVFFISCLRGKHFYTLPPEITLIEPGFSHQSGVLGKAFFYTKIIFFIRSTVRRIAPDTILSFGDWFNPLTLGALIGTSYPVYISDRISPQQPIALPIRLAKKLLYPRSKGIIAQTQRAADYKYKTLGKDINLRIIPNALRNITDIACPKKKQVLHVGRLAWEKGVDRLIDAFAMVKNHDDWNLVIAGDGPLMNELQNRALKCGIANRTFFLGKVKEIDKLFAESEIFVIPSYREGFPNSLAEAMASPLPCVSFDCIPSGDVMTNDIDGIIIPDGDVALLSQTLTTLMDDETLRSRLSNKAIEIRDRLNVNTIGDRYLDFIL